MADKVEPIEDEEFIVFNAALIEVAKQGDVGHLLQLHDDLAETGASGEFMDAVSFALVGAIGNIAASASDDNNGVVELLVERLTGKARPNEDEVASVVEHFQPELYPLSSQVYIEGMKLMAASTSMNFVPYIAQILDKRNLDADVYIEGMNLLKINGTKGIDPSKREQAFEEIEAILERDASKKNHGDICNEERGKILEKLVEIDLDNVPEEDMQYAELFSKIFEQQVSEEVQRRIAQGVLSHDVDLAEEGNKLANWMHPQTKEYFENELATLDREKTSHPLIEEEVGKCLTLRVQRENLDEKVYLKGMEFLAKGGKFRVLADMHTRVDVTDRVKTEAIRLLRRDLGHLRSKEVLSTVLSNLRANRPIRQSSKNVIPIGGSGNGPKVVQ